MRVVYLSASGELGGAEISLLDILTSIRRAEPDWLLQLIVAQEGPLASKARALGIPAVVVPFPPALARLVCGQLAGERLHRAVALGAGRSSARPAAH
jgi:hypothetical protein